MEPDSYNDVHVQLMDGRWIYLPKDDMARYAPATVCQVTHRIKVLRKLIESATDLPVKLKRELDHIARPIPYEKEYDSSCSITVHNAIKDQGRDIIDEDTEYQASYNY